MMLHATATPARRRVRHSLARLVTVGVCLLCARCDCIYPYFEECRGLEELRCAARSDEVLPWHEAHCVVVRKDGRFVRCRPVHNTGRGF